MKMIFAAAACGLLMFSPVMASAQTSGPLAINVMSTAAFIDNATWGGMFAVQSSRLALEKSGDPKIREFAQAMIRDHSRENKLLETTLSSDPVAVSPPTLLDRESGVLLDKLLLASPGVEFDRLYIAMLIDRYERVLQLHRAYSVTGENTLLKQLAASMANRTRERLNRAGQLSPTTASERMASGEK